MDTLQLVESLNRAGFLAINAGAHPAKALYWFTWCSAELLIYLLATGLVIGWLLAANETRRTLAYAALVAVTALLINQLIGLAWYHPRPFEIGLGHTLMPHKFETSFPSDHATVFFGITLAMLSKPGLRRWGLALVPLGLLVAWSRIWLGVHYPLDILGSLFVAGGVVAVFGRPLWLGSGWLNDRAQMLWEGLARHLAKPS